MNVESLSLFMKKFISSTNLMVVFLMLPLFISAQNIPAPQSLVVSLTGYKNSENKLKCKLYYMVTLPDDPSFINSIHLTLEKPLSNGDLKLISDINVPFDWAEAQKTDGVISFYTTRNLLYIGIGEFDLLRKYQCKVAFVDDSGQKSKYAFYKK
jgi:hypothetical protein